MYPNQIRSFQLSKTWDIRFLITLQLVLFFVDGYFVAIAGLQIIRILRWNQHYKGLFDAIFNQLCILLLGLFSPIFIYMSFMTHLVIPFPKRMKSLIGFHTAVIFIQVLYTILFPKSSYHKPDHLENLTTLQRWATLFDSFSLPIPVIIIKLIHVVITVTRLTNHSNKVKNI
ncbi:hypothetical protein BC833DRAFT_599808 [Globomyces pollinis-pini]|nr:hypothetical protein BC833DRAFT_599808 [Globomyces pollinis-pini]